MNNITLIGMPGSGKSTVGVLLAKALGFQFVDVDLLIQQREGALLQELLDNRGVEPFLDAEEAAICSLACTGAVIAPGGSAVCRAGAIGHLRALGRVVYLHVPLPELERRIHNITTRGIAMAPGQTLADVYAAREPLYRLEQRLPQRVFIRCQRSFLVNLLHVREIAGSSLYLNDGTEISLGRGNKADVTQAYRQFCRLRYEEDVREGGTRR